MTERDKDAPHSTDSLSCEGIRVLVVEDEHLIRADIVAELQDAGFDVMEAEHADNAIKLLEEHPDIRLVFTDVNMPGSMDGLKMANYIRDRWPPIKLLVVSGQVHIGVKDLPPGGRFLRKPYLGGHVVRTITEMIQS